MQKLWNVIVTTEPRTVDAVAAVFENDSLALTVLAPPRKAQAHIEALYDAMPDRAALMARLAIVAAVHRIKIPKIEIRETPKLDWLKKVAGDFPPLPIARWVVYGAQHKKAISPSRFNLQIDATSAFGTGEHPTTRGCLLMLDRILKRDHHCAAPIRLLDMGCGSGILAMAWAQAMRGQAIGVDLDPESVLVAKNNVRVNGLQQNVRIGHSRGYGSPRVRQSEPYDFIMANIFAGPLCKMAKELKQHLKPGGTVILAGLLNRQANSVLAAHRMQGLRLEKRLIIGEWSILALRRPKSAK